jgi:cytochrome P450 family 150 subfamily A5
MPRSEPSSWPPANPGKLGEPFPQDPFSFLTDWFTAYIEDRRRQPRDDVLTQMSLSTFPDGSTPEAMDVVRAVTFLFAGGQGTSARFLGNIVQMLAEDLDLQQLLRRERDRIPNLLEEGLRVRSRVKVNSESCGRRRCSPAYSFPP